MATPADLPALFAQLEDRLEQRLGARIDAAEQRLGARIDGVEARIDGVEQRLGARIDAVEQRLSGISLGTQQLIRDLDERTARLTDRFGGLEVIVGQTNAQLVQLHVEFAELRGRLDRLSSELTRGRTIDTDRLRAIERRLDAIEVRLAPGK